MNWKLGVIIFHLHCSRDNPQIPDEKCDHQDVHSFQDLVRFFPTSEGFNKPGASRRSKVGLALHAPDVVGELVRETRHATLHLERRVSIEVVAVIVAEFRVSTAIFTE
jgi:hypothetical protein